MTDSRQRRPPLFVSAPDAVDRGEMNNVRSRSYEKELFEHSPILRSVTRLAAPVVMGQIILVVYNMVDTFFITLTGNAAMVAAAGVCMPAFMFISAVSNLFGIGGAGAISRALGRGDHERVRQASSFACWGCAALTLCYSLFALLFRDAFVDLLGGGQDAAVHGFASDYLLVTVALGGLATAMAALLSHLIRSEGRSLEASLGIMLGGVSNIALDPLFMFALLEPGREVLGAAAATALSNVLSLAYFAAIILRNRRASSLRFRPERAMLDRPVVRSVLVSGLPACLMTLLENVSFAVLENLMSAYTAGGQVFYQAGLSVAKKINMLAHCIVRGMSQGVLPLIGYNYAAKNYHRMKQAVLYSAAMSVAMAAACMLISLIFSRPMVGLFNQTGDGLEWGARFLRILALGGPFSAAAYATISFFQATGKGGRSLFLALLRKGLLDIPIMLLLNPLIPVCGIVMATPITDVICSGVAVVIFSRFLKSHGIRFDARDLETGGKGRRTPRSRPPDAPASPPVREDEDVFLLRGKADANDGEDQLITGWLRGFKRDRF